MKRIDWHKVRLDLGPAAQQTLEMYKRLGSASEAQIDALRGGLRPAPVDVGEGRRYLDQRWQSVWDLYTSLPGFPMIAYHGLVAVAIADRAPVWLVERLGRECFDALGMKAVDGE